jgi:hypothetical protein
MARSWPVSTQHDLNFSLTLTRSNKTGIRIFDIGARKCLYFFLKQIKMQAVETKKCVKRWVPAFAEAASRRQFCRKESLFLHPPAHEKTTPNGLD